MIDVRTIPDKDRALKMLADLVDLLNRDDVVVERVTRYMHDTGGRIKIEIDAEIC